MYLKSYSWIFVTFTGYLFWVFLYMLYMKSFPSAGRELFINQNCYTRRRYLYWGVKSKTRHRAPDAKPLWLCKVVVNNIFLFLWLVTQFFSAEPTTKCITMLSHMWSKKWTETINLRHKKKLKIVQCSPRVVETVSQVESTTYPIISLETFELLLLFWQTNVFHMLHFSHKDFTAMKKSCIVRGL